MAPRAVLIGLPGSGKTTIGRRLAKAMGLTLLDTDAAIEEKTGRTIADIFAVDGEGEFRRVEEEVIREALEAHDGVLSLGGGAVTTAGVRECLAGQTVVFLDISASEGVRRTSGSTVRPLLAGPDHAEKYRKLMSERVPLYRRVATIRVNTNRRNPGAVVRHIVNRLENPQPPRRRRSPWRRSGTFGPSQQRSRKSADSAQSDAAELDAAKSAQPDEIRSIDAVPVENRRDNSSSVAKAPLESAPVTPATVAARRRFRARNE